MLFGVRIHFIFGLHLGLLLLFAKGFDEMHADNNNADDGQEHKLKLDGPEMMLSVNLHNRYQPEYIADTNNRKPSEHARTRPIFSVDVLQVEYEKLIANCLGRITQQLETCVQEFNDTYKESWAVQSNESPNEDEKVRNFCCIQNDFKECWIRAIRRSCNDQERPLSRWLPVMVLKDLRNDTRCSNYVLYPHKCRDNLLNLWQIFTFLILVPFVTSLSILGIILYHCPSRFIGSTTSLVRDHSSHHQHI